MEQKIKVPTSLPELTGQMTKYLEEQGFKVIREARIRGKSGIEHTFNLLAMQDDGFADFTIAINIIAEDDSKTQMSRIFDFANVTYDTGIRDRIMIALSHPVTEVGEFALRQRIRLIDGEKLQLLLATKPERPANTSRVTSFETRTELQKALVSLGYRIEEKARVRGRSGAEYTFDILAYEDQGLLSHSLCLNILSENEEVELDQVSLFDTRAYDAGIDHKAIFVTGRLTAEARLFAEHQQIKILESPKPAKEETSGKVLPRLAEKPGEAETTGGKPQPTRPPKQKPQPDALQLIPEVMARRYNAIPMSITGNTMEVAMANPTDIFALEAFATQSKKRIRPIAATTEEVREAIDQNYKAYGEIEEHLSRVSIASDVSDEKLAIGAAVDAPLAQALNLVIEEAAKTRSSDIHIEPEENRLRIRYRIDGTLHDTMSLSLNIHRALISRIKILGG